MRSKHRRMIAGAASGVLLLSLVLLLAFDLSLGGKSSPRYYSGSAGYGLILSTDSGPMENALLDLSIKLQLPTLVLSGEEPIGDALSAAAAQSGLPEDRFFLAATGERVFPLLEQTNRLEDRPG